MYVPSPPSPLPRLYPYLRPIFRLGQTALSRPRQRPLAIVFPACEQAWGKRLRPPYRGLGSPPYPLAPIAGESERSQAASLKPGRQLTGMWLLTYACRYWWRLRPFALALWSAPEVATRRVA